MLRFGNKIASIVLLVVVIACTVPSVRSDWHSDEDDFFKDSEETVGRSIDSVDHSGHEDHSGHQPVQVHSHLVEQGAPAGYIKNSMGGQGGNNAGYGENCGPTGKTCWQEAQLYCNATDGTGKCDCTQGHVYVGQTETCWVIPASEHVSCGHNIQCQKGIWGIHSWCSKTIAKCECHDNSFPHKRPTKPINGVCYIEKKVGDLCDVDDECRTVNGGAYCQPGDYMGAGGGRFKGSCQCREGRLSWPQLNACLAYASKPGDSCRITEQCTKGSLGDYSRCTESQGCQCYYENRNNTEVPTVYYKEQEKCFIKKAYNDTCRSADECKASLGPDVECGLVEESSSTEQSINARPRTVCHCPKGKVCRNSGFSIVSSASLLTPLLFALVHLARAAFMTQGV